MSHHSHSVYEDDIFSTTSSVWTTTYRRIPEKTPFAMKFMQWAAGAPVGAKAMKKKVRDFPDDRSTRSGSSSSSYSYWMDDSNVQMYWVVPSDTRSSYSSASSSASRSSKGSRKSRKPRRGGPPVQPMGFPPAPGHFQQPPPPPMGHFGGGGDFYEGAPPPMAPPPMHHPSPMNVPPPPPPPMAGGGGDAPAFFDLTGQGGAGVSFNHHGPEVYSDDESDYSSGYSDGYEH